MSEETKIEILSRLPVDDLTELIFMASLGIGYGTSKVCNKWGQLINLALEAKQAEILKGYDDEQITGI